VPEQAPTPPVLRKEVRMAPSSLPMPRVAKVLVLCDRAVSGSSLTRFVRRWHDDWLESGEKGSFASRLNAEVVVFAGGAKYRCGINDKKSDARCSVPLLQRKLHIPSCVTNHLNANLPYVAHIHKSLVREQNRYNIFNALSVDLCFNSRQCM
jgi:hypothetical protein